MASQKYSFVVVELIVQWLKNLGASFTNAVDRIRLAFKGVADALPPVDKDLTIKAIVNFFWKLIQLPFDLLGIIDTFVGDFLTAEAEAIITVAVARLRPPPKGWSSQVVTRAQVWSDVLNFILSTGYGIVSLHIPLPVKIYLQLKSYFGLVTSIGKEGDAYDKILKFLVKKGVKAFRLSVVRIFFSFVATFGTFLLLALAYFFVDFMERGQICAPLSQRAPRMKVHAKEGGVIRRRAPGGAPP